MIYQPYKNLGGWRKTVKYLGSQNLLMRMVNFTLLSMFISVSVFLILLTYTFYNDTVYTRLIHSVLVDVILNFVNIYLQLKESDSPGRKVNEFVPESFRLLALIFYYVFVYQNRDSIFIYLTILYGVPILYRLIGWTRYSKMKFFGVDSGQIGTD